MKYLILHLADRSNLHALLPLVRAYHEFENIVKTDVERVAALEPLLVADSPLGRIWLIAYSGEIVGYIALCFGYSIEFGGRDAFIDEFFLVEEARSKGIGSAVLAAVKKRAASIGVKALHLEVARTNKIAKELYERLGFRSRAAFQLMSCQLDGKSIFS
jgi:ribosomal protein S18 acetylase RimI-like enzyme